MAADDLGLAARWRRRSRKLAAAVSLLVLDLRSLAPKPFHPDANGEHADGQQRNELAPADGAAGLNGAAQHGQGADLLETRGRDDLSNRAIEVS